jgi:hypothetical protein
VKATDAIVPREVVWPRRKLDPTAPVGWKYRDPDNIRGSTSKKKTKEINRGKKIKTVEKKKEETAVPKGAWSDTFGQASCLARVVLRVQERLGTQTLSVSGIKLLLLFSRTSL